MILQMMNVYRTGTNDWSLTINTDAGTIIGSGGILSAEVVCQTLMH